MKIFDDVVEYLESATKYQDYKDYTFTLKHLLIKGESYLRIEYLDEEGHTYAVDRKMGDDE